MHWADVSVDIEPGFTFNNDCGYLGVGRAGSIPFVSEKPGTYGRLLLAVYVRWRTGLLISSDWLRPVTRGAWRAVLPDRAGEPNPVHPSGNGHASVHLQKQSTITRTYLFPRVVVTDISNKSIAMRSHL